MKEIFYVYILTNVHHTVLYVGMTSNLPQRIYQHEEGVFPKAFTKKYNVAKLVYCEEFSDAASASQREYSLKRWKRAWKEDLITTKNPTWQNLQL